VFASNATPRRRTTPISSSRWTKAIRLGAPTWSCSGIGGGRLDHLLANLLVLASLRLAPCRIIAFDGAARVHVARGGEPKTVLTADIGEVVTLVPLAEMRPASRRRAVVPLHGESLAPGTSRRG